MRFPALVVVLCGAAFAYAAAQTARQRPAQISPQEQADLESALSEAGSSPTEYLRAIEKHLEKYPNSPRRAEFERAAVRAAIEAHDDRRIILFGERVLTREPDDLQILDQVSRALLSAGSSENAAKALAHARHYEELIRRMQQGREKNAGSAADWQNSIDRGIARAQLYQARANANLGHPKEALAMAQLSFETMPGADSAREIAACYETLDRPEDAARAMADAFTIADPSTTDAARALDRARMGELYAKAKGSEAGLGDIVLEAYDRNLALLRTREIRLRATDPNVHLSDPMEFTLAGVEVPSLNMSSLKGKVVVFDFWATWCGPCRAQHPLYQQVKKRFQDDPTVVFLSIDTDEDRTAVKPFLSQVHWTDKVYFEDGLSRALQISTIPTTIITDKNGKVFSRMNGYNPERFVDALTTRIRDALAN